MKIELKDLVPGTDYKLAQTIKNARIVTKDEGVPGEYMDVQPFKKGMTITVVKQNKKSVRIKAKFKDTSRKVLEGRLVYDDNEGLEIE